MNATPQKEKNQKPKHVPKQKDDLCPYCGGHLSSHDYYRGFSYGCDPDQDYKTYVCDM